MEDFLTFEEVYTLYNLNLSFTREHYSLITKGYPIYYKKDYCASCFSGCNEVCHENSVGAKKITREDIRVNQVLTAVECMHKE